jgi:iron complex transport system substrate-binding protein
VGTDKHANWPASVKALPKLGGLDDTQLEALVRLKPDVVLLAKSARIIATLEALGIPVLALSRKPMQMCIVYCKKWRPYCNCPILRIKPMLCGKTFRQVSQAKSKIPAQANNATVYLEASTGVMPQVKPLSLAKSCVSWV